jgi:hypothetical protein
MIAPVLAEWGTGPLDPPDAVRTAALRHLLDGVGTAIGGLRSGTVEPAVVVASGLAGAHNPSGVLQPPMVSAWRSTT